MWIYPCVVIDNYDGDTFELELDLGFGLTLREVVRLHGVDTPEMRGGNALTKAAAVCARDRAASFLADNIGQIRYRSIERSGKYGRGIGDILVGSEHEFISLADWLIEHRLGAPYYGGSRAQMRAEHEENARHLLAAGEIEVQEA